MRTFATVEDHLEEGVRLAEDAVATVATFGEPIWNDETREWTYPNFTEESFDRLIEIVEEMKDWAEYVRGRVL